MVRWLNWFLGGSLLLVLSALSGICQEARPASMQPEALASVSGAVSFALAPPPATRDAVSVADPFPIRRVVVPWDRLPVADPQTGKPLQKLSRQEFEELVRNATRASAPGPHLMASKYQATLTATGLRGNAEWVITNPGQPRLMTIDPLRLAVNNPRWSDGTDALLVRTAAAAPASTQVWVPASGPQTMRFDWSLRGIEEPGDIRFDLRIPASPISILELDLPVDASLVPIQADVFVTGPERHDAVHRWKLMCSGLTRIEFAVRGTSQSADLPPLYAVKQASRFDLSPGQAEARYEFDIEAIRNPSSLWELELDPRLRILDVVATARESWAVTTPTPGGSSRLLVRFREPTSSARISVSAVAPFPADGTPWVCPMVRPASIASGRDTIELRLSPDVVLQSWDTGDYHVLQSSVPSERGLTLQLSGALNAAEALTRRAPAIQALSTGAEYTTQEEFRWQIETQRSRLAVQFQVTVERGPLSQLTFQIPDGFQPESIAPIVEDSAALAQAGPQGTWIVEPSRPLNTGQTIKVQLLLTSSGGPAALHPASADVPPPWTRPLPDVIPRGARARSGRLSIVPSRQYQLFMHPEPVLTRTGQETSYALNYTQQIPQGAVQIVSQRPLTTVEEKTHITRVGDILQAQTDLKIQHEGTAVHRQLIMIPQLGNEPWTWTIEGDNVAISASPALDHLYVWRQLAPPLFPLPTYARIWQVQNTLPGRSAVELRIRGTLPCPDRAVVFPVPEVLGAEAPHGAVTMDPSAGFAFDSGGPSRHHIVAAGPMTILHPDQGASGEDQSDWSFRNTQVSTRVQLGGVLACRLETQVTRTGAAYLPMTPPPDAIIQSISVGDRSVRVTQRGDQLLIPIPAVSGKSVPLKVEWIAAARVTGLWPRITLDTPRFAAQDATIHYHWETETGYWTWPNLKDTASSASASIVLVDRRVPLLTTIIVTCLMISIAVPLLAMRRGIRSMTGVLVIVAIFAGASCLVMTATWGRYIQPVFALALVLLVVCANARLAPRAARGPIPSSMRTASRVVLAIVLGAPLVLVQAQGPLPAQVYFVPDTQGGYSAFAPVAVLDRLKALASPGLPPLVIATGEYTGAEIDGTAHYDATFIVHSHGTQEQILQLPLSGIRLESVRVDGSPTYPDASQPEALLIPISGAGRHVVTLKFTVPITVTGADREVRFSIPDLPTGTVRFRASPGAEQLSTPTRRGDARVEEGNGNGPQIHADLGGGRILAIRWRVGNPGEARPGVRIQQICIWDLGTEEHSATLGLLYQIERGYLNQLTLKLPPGMEPGRVTIRSIDSGSLPTPNTVKSWTLTPEADGWQTFQFRTQNPLEGRVAVMFRMVSRRPPHQQPRLLLPQLPDAVTSDSYLAVRAAATLIERYDKSGLIDYPAAALAQEFALIPELDWERKPITRAFRKDGTDSSQLTPKLAAPPPPLPLQHDLQWRVGEDVHVAGTLRWSAEQQLSVLEFDVPNMVEIKDVKSPELAGWFRVGTRIHCWLRLPQPGPTISWQGRLIGLPDSRTEDTPIDLPFPGGDLENVTARVTTEPGWSTTTVEPAGDPLLTRFSKTATKLPRVILHRPLALDAIHEHHQVEDLGSAIRWTTDVKLNLPMGRQQVISLEATDVPDEVAPPQWIGPVRGSVTTGQREGNSYRWTVTCPEGGLVHLQIQALLPPQAILPCPSLNMSVNDHTLRLERRRVSLGHGLQPVGVSIWNRVSATRQGAIDATQGSMTVWNISPRQKINLRVTRLLNHEASEASQPLVDPTPATLPPASGPAFWVPGTFNMTLVVWLMGLAGALSLVILGPWVLWPEYLVLLGVLASLAAGAPLLAVAVLGLLARVYSLARRLFASVLQ